MATWNEFESGVLANTLTKIGDGQYVITINVAEGQGYPVIIFKGLGGGDTWADCISAIGNVPDEKLNELLRFAIQYNCGALVKAEDNYCVRYSFSLVDWSMDAFAAVMVEVAKAAAALKSQFCPE
ncbi:MAG: hypothetical protein LBQ57_11380 [Spirochaetales bacterium]|jgi:hypothetical protein|nr:hypothetical protein [Spirochaetales bacterium]